MQGNANTTVAKAARYQIITNLIFGLLIFKFQKDETASIHVSTCVLTEVKPKQHLRPLNVRFEI